MDLKVLSWNVEHFTGHGSGAAEDRLERVIDLVRGEDPDIFAILEVKGVEVFDGFTEAFPDYTFSMTEGSQMQEIMIGVRPGLPAFFTQRNEFKRSNPYLRPAALMSIKLPDSTTLSLLISHLKSMPSPEGFGLRDAMFEKVRGLKKAIDAKSASTGNEAKFVLLGDLNTMGLNMTFSDADLTGAQEIERLDKVLAVRDLKRKQKTHPNTFFNGTGGTYPPADLDHVYATENLIFEDAGGGAQVRVGGWVDAADPDAWIEDFSDHAFLSFTLKDL